MTKEEILQGCIEYFNGDTLAANVFLDKYAMKTKEGVILESTPRDMHRRIANEFARIETKYPNPVSEGEIFRLLDGFKYVVPQGSPMAGIGNPHLFTSLSNCFVIGSNDNADSYGSIMRTDEEQVQLMKRRGGVGHDLSHLRSSGSLANNAVLSGMAGSILYAQRYSNSTKEVRQGDRRGALMLSISVIHPDAESFIDSKLEQGRITDANISVRITDEFMACVKNNCDFYQTFPITKTLLDYKGNVDEITKLPYNKLIDCGDFYIKRIHAKKLWNKIIHNAWKSAEPGVLFWDTILKESPADCYEGFQTLSTNPCVTGDTLIAVADGRNAVTIRQLTEENRDFLVYATNPKTGKINIKYARNPRKTGDKVEVYKLTLDDGTFLMATPNHRIMLKNGSYKELKDLECGQSLMPFNTYLSEGSWNDGYRCINSRSDGSARQYRLIYEFYHGKYDGKVWNVHHKDGNRLNDLCENLELVDSKVHSSEHRLGEKNPYYTHPNVKETLLKHSSHPGTTNCKYIDISNEEIIEHGRICLQNNGSLSPLIWDKYVSESKVKIPSVNSNFRFGTFLNFKSCVINNHKVESVDFYGYEDVFNLTVDDFHNYNVITSGDESFVRSSGITVANCGEIPLSDGDACRLLLMNLYSYVEHPFSSNAVFDYHKFSRDVFIAQRLMDDLVDLEIEKIETILRKIETDPEPEDIKRVEKELWQKILLKTSQGRRTGLGVTAEGDMLAALGVKYGSEESIEISIEVHKTLAMWSYKSSIYMASERGSFTGWSSKLECDNPFVNRILRELYKTDRITYNMYYEFGRRNISNLTISPAGTVSLLTQTTSGIEPAFNIYYTRRRRTIDKSKAVFTDAQGEMFEESLVFHHKFVEWYNLNWFKLNPVHFDIDFHKPIEDYSKEEIDLMIQKSPYFGSTANDVNWVDKVKLQGSVQKWVDHSISATTNVPEKTSEEVVSDIYMTAYESGCKGMTIYREGSRSGILVNAPTEKKEEFDYIDAVKRPKELECDIYHKTALKQDWMILVGKYENKPYEIFAFPDPENHEFPTKIEKGKIVKVRSGVYKLVGSDGEKQYEITNIIKLIDETGQTNTRKFSLMLRHHVDPIFIIKDIEQYALITSFDRVIQRVLRNYVIEVGEVCPECKSELSRNGGCVQCSQCGWSKCS